MRWTTRCFWQSGWSKWRYGVIIASDQNCEFTLFTYTKLGRSLGDDLNHVILDFLTGEVGTSLSMEAQCDRLGDQLDHNTPSLLPALLVHTLLADTTPTARGADCWYSRHTTRGVSWFLQLYGVRGVYSRSKEVACRALWRESNIRYGASIWVVGSFQVQSKSMIEIF